MHLITISNLRQDAKPYPDVQKQIKEWYDIVKTAEWQSLIDVPSTYRDAEAVGNFTIFNGTKQIDLVGIIGSKGVVSEVVNGSRFSKMIPWISMVD